MTRIITALILTLLVATVAPVFAAPASRETIKKEKRLEDVKRRIREEKKAVETVTERETSVLSALDEINRNLVAARVELAKAEQKRADIEPAMRDAAANINRLEAEKAALSQLLRRRLRAMYKMRRGAALAAVFSVDSVAGLGRRHKYLTMIMDSDSILIDNYDKNLLALKGERTRLVALSKEMDIAKQSVLLKKAEAEAAKKRKTALLYGVKHEKTKRLKVLKELEGAAAELADLLAKLRSEGAVAEGAAGFAAMQGRLAWPVDGKVVSSYGQVKNTKFNTVVFNNGIVIGAPEGAEVKSVYGGKIAFVGWLKGYGQVMIIEHGNGFYTLFAYLSKVLMDKGAAVASGDIVALVGDTGPEGRAGLYFEIRQRGVPRDPEAWFAANGKK